MKVVNVMADGTIVKDLTGKVVKVGEAKDFYKIIKN